MEDVRFLRDLVLRSSFDRRMLAPYFAGWGIAWIVTYTFAAVAGNVPVTVGIGWVMTVAAVAWPFLLLGRGRWSLRDAVGGGTVAEMPLLLRALYTAWAAIAALAFGLIAALHAWSQPVVVDGGYWLLIVGAGYAVAGTLFSRMWAWLGVWLLAVGIAVPLLLTGPLAVATYALLGGGGFVVTAALVWWGAR